MKNIKKLLNWLKSFFIKEDVVEYIDNVTTDEELMIDDSLVEIIINELELTQPKQKTNKNADIKTFLWKPESDSDRLPVVLVSCDDIVSEDLKMEIVGKGGKVLKIQIQNTGRANGLPGFELGRIHFRVSRSAEVLTKNAPVAVRFYMDTKDSKHYFTIKGKESIKILRPIARVDIR